MKNPFDFFDKVLYINLRNRVDRKEKMEKLFNRYGINAQRFEAISISKEDNDDLVRRGCYFYDEERPEYAPRIKSATLSHLTALFHSKLLNVENVLVLEDDITFSEDIETKLLAAIGDLKKREWDIFFLGCQPFEAYKETENISKVIRATSAHAYCVNGKYIQTLIDEVNFKHHPVIDTVLGHMGRSNNSRSYMTNTPLAIQEPGHSDIENTFQDLTLLQNNRYKDNIK